MKRSFSKLCGSLLCILALCFSTAAHAQPTEVIYPMGPTTFCVGQSVILVDGGTVPSVISWQWYFNGMPIPGATLPTYTASAMGVYNLVVFDGTNYYSSNPIFVSTFQALPTPTITSSNGWVCPAQLFTLTASTTCPTCSSSTGTILPAGLYSWPRPA